VDTGERQVGRIELFLVAARNDDGVTPLMKLLRQLKPNAARSTGYQDGPFL